MKILALKVAKKQDLLQNVSTNYIFPSHLNAIQASQNVMHTSSLDSLVSNGTITQSKEYAILAAMQTSENNNQQYDYNNEISNA